MRLATVAAEGRPIRPLATNGIMRTDAADVDFGGMLALNGNLGDPGTSSEKMRFHKSSPESHKCIFVQKYLETFLE
jgi:hypothetical protein